MGNDSEGLFRDVKGGERNNEKAEMATCSPVVADVLMWTRGILILTLLHAFSQRRNLFFFLMCAPDVITVPCNARAPVRILLFDPLAEILGLEP